MQEIVKRTDIWGRELSSQGTECAGLMALENLKLHKEANLLTSILYDFQWKNYYWEEVTGTHGPQFQLPNIFSLV